MTPRNHRLPHPARAAAEEPSAGEPPSAGDVPSVYGVSRAGGVPSGEEGPSACEALSGRGQQGAERGFLAGEVSSAQEPGFGE